MAEEKNTHPTAYIITTTNPTPTTPIDYDVIMEFITRFTKVTLSPSTNNYVANFKKFMSDNSEIIKRLQVSMKAYIQAIKDDDIRTISSMGWFNIHLKLPAYVNGKYNGLTSVYEFMVRGYDYSAETIQQMIYADCIDHASVVGILCRMYDASGNLETGNMLMKLHRMIFNNIDEYRHYLLSWRGSHGENALHRVFHGHASHVRIKRLATDLLEIGLDPYAKRTLKHSHAKTPFDFMVTGLYSDLVRKYVNGAHADIINSKDPEDFDRNSIMTILMRYASTKDIQTHVTIADICRSLINKFDMSAVDIDGCNITDYMIKYNWIGTPVHYIFQANSSLEMFTTNTIPEQYSYASVPSINPSPFAALMYKYKWHKVISDGMLTAFVKLTEVHGMPSMDTEEIISVDPDCSNSTHKFCSSCKRCPSLNTVMRRCGFTNTHVDSFLRGQLNVKFEAE